MLYFDIELDKNSTTVELSYNEFGSLLYGEMIRINKLFKLKDNIKIIGYTTDYNSFIIEINICEKLFKFEFRNKTVNIDLITEIIITHIKIYKDKVCKLPHKIKHYKEERDNFLKENNVLIEDFYIDSTFIYKFKFKNNKIYFRNETNVFSDYYIYAILKTLSYKGE